VKKALLVLFLLIAGAVVWAIVSGNKPAEVPFAKVQRETLVSTLTTNGKVEPLEWRTIRSEIAGSIERIAFKEGDKVKAGSVAATVRLIGSDGTLAEAQSRRDVAAAELERLSQGGRSSEIAEIDSALSRARLNRQTAQKDVESLRRLVEKNAATPSELDTAERRVRELDLEVENLGRKRASLVSDPDRAAAQARLREAEAAINAARSRLALTRLISPIAGTVYNVAARPGAYVNAGDPIASVGRLDQLRVRVYVDEPELGRVAAGQPVQIVWDAMPGETWKGSVERLPTEIVALGTRQVGEVICTIENSKGRLIPGTNVNAEIRTNVVQSALTIPKEAIRTEAGQSGVFQLKQDAVEWRKIIIGASSTTRSQVVSGLAEDDAVALASDQPLKSGQRVTPVFP
jgi:HlyD family secretion protein